MIFLQRILVAALSLVILVLTFELIRRPRLREEYAYLWIPTGIVIVTFSIFPEVLYFVSGLFGFYHLTMILFVTFLFLMCIVLHFSTVISQITEHETELVQHLVMLEWKMKKCVGEKNLKEKWDESEEKQFKE